MLVKLTFSFIVKIKTMKWETHLSFPLSEQTSSGRHMENLLGHSNTLLNALTRIPRITSSNQVEEISQSAKNISEYLPLLTTPEKIIGIDKDDFKWDNYVENYYTKILINLISKFDHNFPTSNDKINQDVLNLFVVEHHLFFSESLSILVSKLKTCSESELNSIMIILEQLLKSNGLIEFLVQNCTTFKTEYNNDIAELNYSNILQMLVSIPSRTANRCTKQNPKFFSVSNIFNILILNLIRTIIILADANKEQLKYEVTPLSEYFGKILMQLYNSNMEEQSIIVQIFELLCQNVFTKHIVNNILYNLNNRCIEKVLILFLKNTSPNKVICKILSKAYDIKDWQYILLTKIPLLSTLDHKNIKFMYNFVSYLVSNETDNHKMAIDLLINLLKTWSNKSAISHTSMEQQLYITKLIIITAKLLDERKVKYDTLIKQDLTRILIKGVPNHLESPNVNVRVIGMATAEIVMSFIKECEGVELKFEYVNFSKDTKLLAEDLKNLGERLKFEEINNFDLDNLCYEFVLKCNLFMNEEVSSEYNYNDLKISQINTSLAKLNIDSYEQKNTVVSQSTSKNNLIIIDSENFELDSDDDLEPYDMSNDKKCSKTDPPSYLRDLRDNLIDASDPEVFTLSLENAEKLIVTQLSNDDVSLALELLEIFMTLEKKYYFDNFDNVVFTCAVNITSIFPSECAEFLSKHFHSEIGSYSIAQRIFMLDVLSQTSRLLSKVNKKPQIKLKESNDVTLAEQTIKKRLEKKTRRFFSNREISNNENKFVKVAGSFFFPLVYGFKSFSTFALTPRYDTDNILLIHFLQTIAILMYSVQNCPIARHMGKEILDISFTLRFHKESKVRLAVLHLIGAVVLNTPKFLLKAELLNEILEARLWLSGVLGCSVENCETNTECRLIAANVLCLVENTLKMDANEVLY